MLKYIKHKHRIQSKCNTDKGTFEIPKKKKWNLDVLDSTLNTLKNLLQCTTLK